MDLLQTLLAPPDLRIDRRFWLPAHRVLNHKFSNSEALCLDINDWKRLISSTDCESFDFTEHIATVSNTNQKKLSTPTLKKMLQLANWPINLCSRHINPTLEKSIRLKISHRATTPFVACDLIAVALASKSLNIIALVISKLTIQPNNFHRLTPYQLSNGSESTASGEKGRLQMISLEVTRCGLYWHIDFAKRLPALHALNLCTKPSGGHERATVPDYVLKLYREEAQELDKTFLIALNRASYNRSATHLYTIELMLSIGLDPHLPHITYGHTALGALEEVCNPEVGIRLLGMLIENGLMNFSLNVGEKRRCWTDSIILQWLIKFNDYTGPQFQIVDQMIWRLISLGYGSSEAQLDADPNLSNERLCVKQIADIPNDSEHEVEETSEDEDEDEDEDDEENFHPNLHIVLQPVQNIPGSLPRTVRKWLKECARIAEQRKFIRELVHKFDSGPLTLRELARNALRRECRGHRFKERVDNSSQIPPLIKDYLIGRSY